MMNGSHDRGHPRDVKPLFAGWLLFVSIAFAIASLLALSGTLPGESVAVGQSASSAIVESGRFEVIQVGTSTAIAPSPTTVRPSPGTLPATTEPTRTQTPGETVVPAATEAPRSPGTRDTTTPPSGPSVPVPTASPAPIQTGAGVTVPMATTPAAPVKPGVPGSDAASAAPSPTGSATGVQAAGTQTPGSAVVGPVATAVPGAGEATASPVAASPPATAPGRVISPWLLVLGLAVVVGSGVTAYFLGRRG